MKQGCRSEVSKSQSHCEAHTHVGILGEYSLSVIKLALLERLTPALIKQ